MERSEKVTAAEEEAYDAEVERRLRFGLTDEEWANPGQAVFSAGLKKMWQVRRAIERQQKLSRSDPEAEENRFAEEAERYGRDEAVRRAQVRADILERDAKLADGYRPLWQLVSGLDKYTEGGMLPSQRAHCILRLLRAVEKVVRYEVRSQKEKGKSQKAKGKSDGADEGKSEKAKGKSDGTTAAMIARLAETDAEIAGWEAEAAAARTYLWDPLREVCFHFEIAQGRLSSLAKEALGISASELVDRVKAESVRGQMKGELKRFLLKLYSPQRRGDAEEGKSKKEKGKSDGEDEGKSEKAKGRSDEDGQEGVARAGQDVLREAEEAWEALKRSRRAPRWHRTTWAMEYGFSSYQRFFRGCLLCYGKTPHQLEVEILEELLRGTDGEPAMARSGEGEAPRAAYAVRDTGERKDKG